MMVLAAFAAYASLPPQLDQSAPAVGLTSVAPFTTEASATFRLGYTATSGGGVLGFSCAITPADAGGRWARSAAPIWKRSWTAAAPSDRGGGGETVVNVTAREFASRPAAWDLQRPALHFVNCSLTQHPGLGLGAGARRPPPLPPASAPRESLGSRFGFRWS
jgi:hypothetical protein